MKWPANAETCARCRGSRQGLDDVLLAPEHAVRMRKLCKQDDKCSDSECTIQHQPPRRKFFRVDSILYVLDSAS